MDRLVNFLAFLIILLVLLPSLARAEFEEDGLLPGDDIQLTYPRAVNPITSTVRRKRTGGLDTLEPAKRKDVSLHSAKRRPKDPNVGVRQRINRRNRI